MSEKSVFGTLNELNVNEHSEKKNVQGKELTYLSWPWAIAEVKKRYEDVSYEIKKDPNGLPYVYDPKTGYMVYTSVTIKGITHEMWLPVMDGANQAMKAEPYTYSVKEYKYGKWTGNYVDKKVEAATMFDINKTIMRCLVKNLAMFGLGLYIYAGEDLPDGDPEEEKKPEVKKPETKKPVQRKPAAKAELTDRERAEAAYPSREEMIEILAAANPSVPRERIEKMSDNGLRAQLARWEERQNAK